MHRAKAFSSFHTARMEKSLWNCEETQSGQVTPIYQREVLSHIMTCSEHKVDGRKKKGGYVWNDTVCLSKSLLYDGVLLSWRCLLWEAVTEFLVLSCVHGFCFPNQTVLISTHKFSSFYPCNILSLIPGKGVSKWLHGAWMLAGIEPLEPSLYFMWLVARSLQIGNKWETCVVKILQCNRTILLMTFHDIDSASRNWNLMQRWFFVKSESHCTSECSILIKTIFTMPSS